MPFAITNALCTPVRHFFFNDAPSLEGHVDNLITKLRISTRITPRLAALTQLQAADELTPKQVSARELIKDVRAFIKTLDPKNLPKNAKLLETELLAARLGITSQQLPSDLDFALFVERERLYNYIARYNHTVGYNGSELLLGPPNRQKPWSEVKHMALTPPPKNPGFSVQPLYYAMNGMQEPIDLYQMGPEGLRVVNWIDPKELDGRWFLDLRLTIGNEPQLTGNHAYYDYIAATGEVYSEGLYRPEKRDNPDLSNAPCRVQYGRIMDGDYSGWCFVDEEVLRVEVDQEEFKKIKDETEKDVKTAHRFHTLGTNCTDWALKILRLRKDRSNGQTNTYIPDPKAFAPRILVSQRVVKFVDAHFDKLPKVIQKICMLTTVIFFNILIIYLGGRLIDKDVNDAIGPLKPHLGWKDICDKEKLMLSSPYRLGKEFFPKIRKWRENKMAELTLKGAPQQEIEKARWDLPPKAFWDQQST